MRFIETTAEEAHEETGNISDEERRIQQPPPSTSLFMLEKPDLRQIWPPGYAIPCLFRSAMPLRHNRYCHQVSL